MSPLPCRIILVDHASRLPVWEALRASAPADLLASLDARPFAAWDVSTLAAVFQVGAGPAPQRHVLPVLARLQACKCRICFDRAQDHLLVILEKRERTPMDIGAMGRELLALLHATPSSGDDDTPVFIAPPAAAGASAAPLLPRVNDPTGLALIGRSPIVVVDDDMMVRGVCTRILQAHFVVFEAYGSHDALALIDRLPFPVPLLVSDITLARMDGVALAEQWLKRFDNARVLLLSGNPYAGKLPSAVSFMQKPFNADELTRTVLRLATTAEKTAPARQDPHPGNSWCPTR